jgi:hypothetical protein
MKTKNLSAKPLIAGFVLAMSLVSALQDAGAQANHAYTMENLYSKTIIGSVSTTGKVVRVAYKGEPMLLPDHPESAALKSAILSAKPSILVETLFALARPRPQDPAAATAELASIYGHLRSIGSLQGIEYWSASRKELRTFYAESYRIDGPDTRKKLPDPQAPLPGKIPASESFFAFQRDLSFGSNVYSYAFSFSDSAFLVTQTNLTRMSYGIVPIIAPGALATSLFVIRAEDAIVFYALSGADAPGVFKGKLEVSFSNRAEALFRWFESKMGK